MDMLPGSALSLASVADPTIEMVAPAEGVNFAADSPLAVIALAKFAVKVVVPAVVIWLYQIEHVAPVPAPPWALVNSLAWV